MKKNEIRDNLIFFIAKKKKIRRAKVRISIVSTKLSQSRRVGGKGNGKYLR